MACPEAVGSVCNVGSDYPVSILELAKRVIAAVDPTPDKLKIEFVSYAKAYGDDFEDCRCRVPCLDKLRQLVGLTARLSLDDIIRELVAWKRQQLAK
jgi:UDP-glucose 4-epimerase